MARSLLVPTLRELQARRVATIRAQLRLDNQAGAFVRRALGWQVDLPEKDRARINREAAKLVKTIQKMEAVPDEYKTIVGGVATFVVACKKARKVFDDYRADQEKHMTALAKSLPVWPWCEAIKGFGAISLAVIVGEAGDLGEYTNPGKLWKRFGLAPKSAYAMVTKDGKEAYTVPKRRRSVMWNVGDSLIKGNRERNGDGEYHPQEYKLLYDGHKATQAEREDVKTPMHAHRRAQRYMEKRLLRNLWQTWKECAK